MAKYLYGTLAFEVNICLRALDLYLLHYARHHSEKGKVSIGIFVSIKKKYVEWGIGMYICETWYYLVWNVNQ